MTESDSGPKSLHGFGDRRRFLAERIDRQNLVSGATWMLTTVTPP